MKTKTIDKNNFGAILGEMAINGLISMDQLSFSLKEYHNPSIDYTTPSNNLWTCFNHVLLALKTTHPVKWMYTQVGVFLYFSGKFNLLNFDDDPEEDLGDVVDLENIKDLTYIPKGAIIPEDTFLFDMSKIEKKENVDFDKSVEITDIKESKVEDLPHQVTLEEAIERETNSLETIDEDNINENVDSEETIEHQETKEYQEDFSELKIDDDTIEENLESEIYFEVKDFSTCTIDDIIENPETGEFLKIVSKEIIEDEEFFKCIPFNFETEDTLENSSDIEIEESNDLSKNEDVLESLNFEDELEINIENSELEDSFVNSNSNIDNREDIEENYELTTEEENNLIETSENSEVEESVNEIDNPIKNAISTILFDLYDEIKEFTYEINESGEQYNILTSENETITLNVDFVNSKIVKEES